MMTREELYKAARNIVSQVSIVSYETDKAYLNGEYSITGDVKMTFTNEYDRAMAISFARYVAEEAVARTIAMYDTDND